MGPARGRKSSSSLALGSLRGWGRHRGPFPPAEHCGCPAPAPALGLLLTLAQWAQPGRAAAPPAVSCGFVSPGSLSAPGGWRSGLTLPEFPGPGQGPGGLVQPLFPALPFAASVGRAPEARSVPGDLGIPRAVCAGGVRGRVRAGPQLPDPGWPLRSGCAPAGRLTPATPSSGWTARSAPSSSTSARSSGSAPRCPGGTRRPRRRPPSPSPRPR